MMRSRIRTTALVTLGLFLTTAAFERPLIAAGKTNSKAAKAGKKLKKKKDPEAAWTETPASGSDSGAMGDDDKVKTSRTEVLGNLGLSPSPLIAFGVTAGKIKADNSGLEGDFTYASGTSNTIAAKVTHIGGRYRKPIMKIGYVAGGAGLRMVSGSWSVLSLDGQNEYPASSSFNAVTLDGAVGGIMQFGSILVGADLLGISFPLFKLGAKTTEPDATDFDAADADAQKAKFNKLAGGMTMTLLKVGVGIYF
jgi:hypothetical protein